MEKKEPTDDVTIGKFDILATYAYAGCSRASAMDFHEIRAVFTQGVA